MFYANVNLVGTTIGMVVADETNIRQKGYYDFQANEEQIDELCAWIESDTIRSGAFACSTEESAVTYAAMCVQNILTIRTYLKGLASEEILAMAKKYTSDGHVFLPKKEVG